MAAKRPTKKPKRKPVSNGWFVRHDWWVSLGGGGFMKPRLRNNS